MLVLGIIPVATNIAVGGIKETIPIASNIAVACRNHKQSTFKTKPHLLIV